MKDKELYFENNNRGRGKTSVMVTRGEVRIVFNIAFSPKYGNYYLMLQTWAEKDKSSKCPTGWRERRLKEVGTFENTLDAEIAAREYLDKL